MKRKGMLLLALVLAALLLSGCAMRTVEEMYAVPKRSTEYSQLQSAIDSAMASMTYCSPLYGDNQQNVQSADLDGDGVEEYLIFASDTSEKPLKVLIFAQLEDGSHRLVETIAFNGAAFEQVEYVDFDDRPGLEIVVGRQVSDQVLRSVSVHAFRNGGAEQLLLIGYSKFLTCDLDQDGLRELMVLRPGEVEDQRGMAMLYSSQGGEIGRSVETSLSATPSQIRRISQGTLQDGTPAVFVASSFDDTAIVTDVFAMQEEKFVNITFSGESDTSVQTLRNYYVYADDLDEDGVLELPDLLRMRPLDEGKREKQHSLLRWFSLDVYGREMDKLYTYHNFLGGWYLELDGALATRITVAQQAENYYFFVWDPAFENTRLLLTLSVFTGADRDEQAVTGGRFALYRTDTAAYAAKLESAAAEFGITDESLTDSFHLIRQDWRTGETQ